MLITAMTLQNIAENNFYIFEFYSLLTTATGKDTFRTGKSDAGHSSRSKDSINECYGYVEKDVGATFGSPGNCATG